jgi:hypothetical protein
MLNWEKDRRRYTPKEFSPDTLPDTGSKQDMLRWATENRTNPSYHCGSHSNRRNQTFKPMNHAVHQLELYVRCVQSNYFYEKPLEHRNEVIICIRKLITRVNTDPRTSSHYARDLVERARSLITNMNTH